MNITYEGQYKITTLDSGAVIKEINQDGKAKPKEPSKPGKDLDQVKLASSEEGKALLVILKHLYLV